MDASARYDSLFQFYASIHNIDWPLLKAQVKAESAFDPDARSPVGAVGLAQFMKATWSEWADGTPGIQELPPHELLDPRNPEAAIRAQAAIMSWLLHHFKGDLPRTLGSYNWGIGNVTRYGLAQAPSETVTYIQRVTMYYDEYRRND